jgi:hypothetical protein
MDPKTLSREDRHNALSSLMFLTEKHSGEIKAQGCANSSKQHKHIAKEEATAPTVTSEAIFIQGTIYAHEKRHVATCDIPGAFLQADNSDFVLMHLDGILAELMVTIAPNLYRKFITTNAKGKPILYVQLKKALYGMMKSTLLFYRKLVADLTSIGFAINPYDPCVANKTIDGHQMTICWHVNDLFLGHKKSGVVDRLLTWLQNRYETPAKPLNVTRGDKHDYLGMNIDFSTPGTVKFDMIPYIKKIFTDFPEQITGVDSSPAADTFSRYVTKTKPNLFQKHKLLHSITQQHSSYFYLVLVGTFKLPFPSSRLMSKHQMKMIGANLNGSSNISMAPATSNFPSQQNHFPLLNGMSTLPIKHTKTAKDTLALY